MHPDGHRGFRFKPGQLGWLTVGAARLRSPPTHSHSSRAPQLVDGRVEMTIRNLGDFTSEIKKVPQGLRVYLDGPYGAFTIGNPADMQVLVAGGIGVTPMMSLIRTLADQVDQRARDPALRRSGLAVDQFP